MSKRDSNTLPSLPPCDPIDDGILSEIMEDILGESMLQPLPNANDIVSPTDPQGLPTDQQEHTGPRRVTPATNAAETSVGSLLEAPSMFSSPRCNMTVRVEPFVDDKEQTNQNNVGGFNQNVSDDDPTSLINNLLASPNINQVDSMRSRIAYIREQVAEAITDDKAILYKYTFVDEEIDEMDEDSSVGEKPNYRTSGTLLILLNLCFKADILLSKNKSYPMRHLLYLLRNETPEKGRLCKDRVLSNKSSVASIPYFA
eukprot:scaffold193172_cov36-Cyclotella_meneghiniana.AAC.2